MTTREAYAVLGLDASSATADEARLRFRQLIRSHHPDGKPSHEQMRANELTRLIVEACVVLRTSGVLRTTMAIGTAREATTAVAQRSPDTVPADAAWIETLYRDCLSITVLWTVLPLLGMRSAFAAWGMRSPI